MNTKQLNTALEIAKSDADLSIHDDSILHGCGLPNFSPVIVTTHQLARFLRWQCVQLNGGIDAHELNNIAAIGRRKFTVLC